jgi:hypothetical protein
MSRKRNTTPVVIVRKDKRIRHKWLHAAAFTATGGLSGVVTAAEAGSHASYNARTRRLAAEAEQAEAEAAPAADAHSAMLAQAAETNARRAIERGTPREQLGLAAQIAYDRLVAAYDLPEGES